MTTKDSAEKIVKDSMVYTLGGSVIPVPLFDLAAITVLQIDMLEKLALLYGADYSQATMRTFVQALTGAVTGRIAGSLLKLIPGVGTVTGAVIMTGSAVASTYAIGHAAIDNLEKTGTLFGDDMAETRANYEAKYEEGKAAAEEMQKESA